MAGSPPSDDEIVQQALRGERGVWPPPGGWAAALLIPTSSLGIAATGLLCSRPLFRVGGATSDATLVLGGTGMLLAMLALSGTGQLLVYRGRAGARSWLLGYLFLLLLLSLVAFWLDTNASSALLATACGCLPASQWLLHSRAYRAFTGYYRARRAAREVDAEESSASA